MLRYTVKILYELCLKNFLNLTKPSLLAIHGSIAPCPGVHAGTFLIFIWHNSTVSRQLRYSLTRESVPQPVSRDKAPCTVAECRLIGVQCRNSMKKKNYDDKAPPLCYNQLKALYFCKRHHITVFTGAHHFEEGRPLRIILQRTWKFSMLYLPINSRKIEMPYVDRIQKVQSEGS